jgi:hypothetical protein
MEVRIESNAVRVAGDFANQAGTIDARVRGVVRHYGMLLQTHVKAHASKPAAGPPGPRIITGDYNRSISLQMSGNAFVSTATVGTNKPQGRRLEFGFVGQDSLGRNYNQPPYPHFRPAMDEIRPGFIAALAAVLTP